MPELFTVFYEVLTPIILVAGLGFIADRYFTFNTKSVSQIVVYLAVPALVFNSISRSTLQIAELGRLVLYTFTAMAIVAIIAWVIGRLCGLPQKLHSAFTLSSTLLNAGNIGLPFTAFAFGPAGMGPAVIIYTATSLVANTLGVFLASWGSAPVHKSLANVFKVPLLYAALLGLLVNRQLFSLPTPITQGLSLLGDSATPLMLIILGVQLSRATIKSRLKVVVLAGSVKVLIGPLVGFGVAGLFHLTGINYSVAVAQMSMPTAVISIILAEEFGSDSTFVSSVVMVSTLCSLVSLTFLLTLIR